MSSVKFDDKTDKAIDAIAKATERALTSGALFIQAQASENAPVDTGRLRASIGTEVHEDYALIGTNVEYAPYVELGTSRQDAQPYLRPAIDNNIAKIKTIMASEYKKGLK